MSGADPDAPVIYSVPHDTMAAVDSALTAGLEYAQSVLNEHDFLLGRTTRKNRSTAEALERDIWDIEIALQCVRKIFAP